MLGGLHLAATLRASSATDIAEKRMRGRKLFRVENILIEYVPGSHFVFLLTLCTQVSCSPRAIFGPSSDRQPGARWDVYQMRRFTRF